MRSLSRREVELREALLRREERVVELKSQVDKLRVARGGASARHIETCGNLAGKRPLGECRGRNHVAGRGGALTPVVGRRQTQVRLTRTAEGCRPCSPEHASLQRPRSATSSLMLAYPNTHPCRGSAADGLVDDVGNLDGVAEAALRAEIQTLRLDLARALGGLPQTRE